MPGFVCKYCGMITENPTIESLPKMRQFDKANRYLYRIICPVCLNETSFWRDRPFPIDKPEGVSE